MQSLSSMLSPLNTSGSTQITAQQEAMAPLSITIPSTDYDIPGLQLGADDNFQGQHGNMWQNTYHQQPLLQSKSPEADALVRLNAELGNRYTYQMCMRMEGGSTATFNNEQDPRVAYDQCIYSSVNPTPYSKDRYYKCAYGQPEVQRVAIRHKLNDDQNVGPDAKRYCSQEPRLGNEQSVIVPNTNFFGNDANTQEG